MARKRKAPSVDAEEQQEDGGPSELTGLNRVSRPDGEANEKESNVVHFNVPFNGKEIICERRQGPTADRTQLALIFTHGAGGSLTNSASIEFANGFAEASPIVSFQGTMNLASRVKSFHAVAEQEKFDQALGGRSMGARAASIAATQDGRKTNAVVLVSFPLVGGKKNESREQILMHLPSHVDALFFVGSNDTQCGLSHLRGVVDRMAARSWICEVSGADHGMSWKWKGSVDEMRRKTGAIAAEWLKERNPSKCLCRVEWSEEEDKLNCTGWFGTEAVASGGVGKVESRQRKRYKS